MKKILAAICLLAAFVTAGAQDKGVIDISVANLREIPDYAGEMGTQALMGTVVDIVGESGYWLQVTTPDGYRAWVNEMALSRLDKSGEKSWGKARKMVCTARNAVMYSSADRKSQPVSDLVRGDILIRDHGTSRHGMLPVSTPGGRRGWVSKKEIADADSWSRGRACTGAAVVEEALKYVGVPYLWGGNSPKGFDCSGLTSYAAAMNGRTLPRNASQQARLGNPVDMADLEPGDLLFFGNHDTGKVSHVGIYIGDGHMVHASQLVRINSVWEREPDCYENISRFLFARRIFD